MLTAMGSPECLESQPLCGRLSILFKHYEVVPGQEQVPETSDFNLIPFCKYHNNVCVVCSLMLIKILLQVIFYGSEFRITLIKSISQSGDQFLYMSQDDSAHGELGRLGSTTNCAEPERLLNHSIITF